MRSRLALGVVDGHVHGPAAPALDPHALGHGVKPHAGGQHVAALHAHVVVRPVSAEHGAVRVVLERGRPVGRDLARPYPAHDHLLRQMLASFVVKSLISASSTLCTTPSPIEAALPLICAAVWISPPPSCRVKVTSAFAWPEPPVSRDLIRSSALSASLETTVTVPRNVIDIAPIFTLI